jgi:hypothetical protein
VDRIPSQLIAGCLVLVLAGCAGADARPAARPALAGADPAAPWRKPGDKVDSILTMPEYLRRFRSGHAEPRGLAGGAGDPTELTRQFLAAVSRGDQGAVQALLVSRAEFAWLVFPEHLYSRPPYELDPEIFWMQLGARSTRGLARVFERYGGKRLGLLDVSCQADTLQLRSAAARLWSPCTVQFATPDGSERRRLFGSIVERDGRAKFLSFANDF